MKGYKLLSINAAAGLLLMLAFFIPQLVMAQAPTLGTYPNTTVMAGRNTIVTPSAAPANAQQAVAYTSTNFTGVFSVNPTNGDVTVTDAKQAGVYTVTVKAFGQGGINSTTFTLTVTNPNCSQGLFTSSPNVATGTDPRSVAIGDFDGDGKQDFAAANYGSNTVSIRLGNGLGGFNSVADVAVGLSPRSVAIGDFNGDGNQDFAAANSGTNYVSIRLGDGLGGFNTVADVAVGAYPFFVAIGDFNGDGNQDFAAANSGTNYVSIRLGDGLGGFSPVADVVVGASPYSVAIGDFNGDGKQDFATANEASNSVSIRIGTGSGGFTNVSDVNVGTFPSSVAIGDFNGDGKQDFATANEGSSNVSIRIGTGSGVFTNVSDVNVGTFPKSVAIGDFDGDGKQDFAAANAASVSIRIGNGSGGFNTVADVAVGLSPRSVAIGDFNGDGKQDFAAARNGVFIRLGGGPEIDVKGNATSITDGDATPSLTDHTDFGSVAVSTPFARTYTISNSGNTDLTIPANGIAISGTNASMFVLSGITFPTTIAAGGSRTFVVTFTPTSTGAKNATVTIANDDCNASSFDFALRGGQVCDFSTCVGKTLTFTATNSGASYAWDFGNGSPISTAQNPTYAYNAAGQYTVTLQLTDVNGCVTSNSQLVCVYDAPVITNTSVNPLCNGASNGSIDISMTGGAPNTTFTYAWSNGATTQDVSGLVAGTYTVTVTDPTTTCFQTLSVTLTEPAVLSASATVGTNVLCFGASTGTASAAGTGGTAPYSYAWSNSQSGANANGLAAGNYTVTVTDANGCSTTASVTIGQPAAALAASETHLDVLCFGNSTGSVDLSVTGGTSPYSYAWSNGAITEDLSGLAAGTYDVTVTDANGCMTTVSATVGQPAAALAASETHVNVLCFGNITGSVDLSVTGGTSPYSYAWSNSATTDDLSGLAAGTYDVTVTDANGCTTTASATVGQPAAALAASETHVDVSCFGNSTGSVDLSVTGGTSPYSYAWSNSAITEDLSGLAAGTYDVTVTDANGCTTTASATVGQPAAALAATETHTNVGCFGASTGTIDLTVTGGTTGYTYLWSNNATTQDLSGLAAGTYTVTITDANGCSTTASATVGQPASALAVAPSNSGNVCNGASSANVLSNASGGTPTYTYLWTPGNLTTQNVNNVGAGTYNVTVTDANGCTATGSTTVGTFTVTPATFIIGQ